MIISLPNNAKTPVNARKHNVPEKYIADTIKSFSMMGTYIKKQISIEAIANEKNNGKENKFLIFLVAHKTL